MWCLEPGLAGHDCPLKREIANREIEIDLDEGVAQREEGKNRVSLGSPEFLKTMRALAQDISERCGSVSIDELRAGAERLNIEPHHRNVWGVIFRGKHWEEVGVKNSEVVSNHARLIRRWRYRACQH
jgi:hypothetical protein